MVLGHTFLDIQKYSLPQVFLFISLAVKRQKEIDNKGKTDKGEGKAATSYYGGQKPPKPPKKKRKKGSKGKR